MKSVLGPVLAGIALTYLGVCALLYFAQRSLLYFPTPEVLHPRAQRLSLPVADATLQVWHRPSEDTQALIYFGGNAEEVSGNFDVFAAALPRHALYLVNYRGYGGSDGRPSEAALLADALTIHDRVAKTHPRVSVVGRSLGSGVAAHVASERAVERLVLVTPYDSIVNVARKFYPFLPIAWLLQDRFDSVARVAKIRAPVLAIFAEHDEVIPRWSSEALIAAFPSQQVTVEVIPGATHNDLGPPSEYGARISRFLSGPRGV